MPEAILPHAYARILSSCLAAQADRLIFPSSFTPIRTTLATAATLTARTLTIMILDSLVERPKHPKGFMMSVDESVE